jgi:predicted HicB family RNase H-like nuclease
MTKDMIVYKDYIAQLSFDIEENIIIGKVINTSDIISFHGKTLEEVKQAFHDVLDAYLEAAAREGINPSKIYSGKFNLRINPDLHRKLAISAKEHKKSLNEFTEEMIEKGMH